MDLLRKPFIIIMIGLFLVSCNASEEKVIISRYPPGYDFALTITDDPDDGWLEQKKSVYDFIDSLGMKTSIGVWVFNNKRGSGDLPYYNQGVSLESPGFLEYVTSLKAKGFEIFLHTVSGGNDQRYETISGFNTYRKYFNEYPNHWINHFTNYENVYWGYKRFNSAIMQFLYKTHKTDKFIGDEPKSRYFWGDYCKKYIKYVRGWATSNINTLKFNPSMPYHDPYKPYVKYWYACSDGANRESFNRLLSRENIDRLIREKGTAIIYTHFASGFVDKKGTLNEETRNLLTYVASHKNGWFVPVNVILDRFIAIRSIKIIEEEDRYIIVNTSNKSADGIVLELYDNKGVTYQDKLYRSIGDAPSRIVIDTMAGGSSLNLMKVFPDRKPYMSFIERARLSGSWLISRFY